VEEGRLMTDDEKISASAWKACAVDLTAQLAQAGEDAAYARARADKAEALIRLARNIHEICPWCIAPRTRHLDGCEVAYLAPKPSTHRPVPGDGEPTAHSLLRFQDEPDDHGILMASIANMPPAQVAETLVLLGMDSIAEFKAHLDALREAAAHGDRYALAVKNGGFRMAPDYHEQPTLWCIECKRDSGFHWSTCSKMQTGENLARAEKSEALIREAIENCSTCPWCRGMRCTESCRAKYVMGKR